MFDIELKGGEAYRESDAITPGDRAVLVETVFSWPGLGTLAFQSIIARDIHGLTPFAASIAFSLNAFGGLVGARLSTRHRHPGWFMASIAGKPPVRVIALSTSFW